MSHGGPGETCHFGHVFKVLDYDKDEEGPPGKKIRKKIRSGEIEDLDQLAEHEDYPRGYNLGGIMGDHYKHLKVSAGSQGTPYMVTWVCADKLDEDNNYEVHKTEEKIFVSPQSNVHQEFMQRKQQAEQNIKQTMQGYEQLKKQKHMLEHDIRKLRSRAEAFESGDETQLKGDFIELVDGAGAGGQQGGDEAALKFYRDNNIYPSIVADFNEMQSLDDLTDGELADLPENEKAILKKKYTMYEKWKDIYGSEIHRKLNELKAELNRVERSIDETEEWLAPYVRDMEMINEQDQGDLGGDMTFYPSVKGTSSMKRTMEFICYRPMKNDHGEMEVIDDEDEATHFRIIYIMSVHVNLAGAQQPQSPAEGPSSGIVYWFPAIVCRHVWENFFQAKVERKSEQFQELMDDYTGDFEPSREGKKLKDARTSSNMSVRELREKIGDEIDEDTREPPIQLSSYIRRIEDGLDDFSIVRNEFEYGDDYVEALTEILDIDLESQEEKDDEMYTGVEKNLRKFTGRVDEFVIDEDDAMGELTHEMRYKYYWDFKLTFGLNTMK